MSYRILVAVILLIVPSSWSAAADRPNVVWIVSEDNSVHYLAHFFEGGAKTPNIEALAAHGLTFDHAFSNAPVCSVARTTLATGCMGPRIGTQYHRRYQLASLPADLRMFPAYLRDAGYYTTNNSKKDYNAIEGKGVWDESSGRATWRNRPDQHQPFFHMQSHAQSHEGSLHFGRDVFEKEKTTTEPAAIKLADYHPDTPIFRYTHARYLDRIGMIDEIVGQTVARLKEDGLLDDTFIFYFGDHGGVLPRSKGYIYESGLHVPLVVRVPENFQHLVPAADGSRLEGFVSFIDFGPTVLNLAGVSVPTQMDGRAFLGDRITLDELNARDEAFGYADRFDEKYDLVRSLRKGKYQYIRNYQPYLPDGLNNNYRYKCLAYAQWRDLFAAGKLSGAPQQFYLPKSVEHLYDCDADPHQVDNLAADPAYAEVLADLRARLRNKVKQLPDLSFYPESYLTVNAMDDPVGFGQSHQEEIATLVDTADLALLPFAEAQPRLRRGLESKNPMIRYWSAMVCTAFGERAKSLAAEVRPLLDDPSLTVRIRAAEFLGLIAEINPQPALANIVNSTHNAVEATEALNSTVWFRDFFDDRYPVERSDFHPVARGAGIDRRLDYINGDPYPSQQRPRPGARQGNQRRRQARQANRRTAVAEEALSRQRNTRPNVLFIAVDDLNAWVTHLKKNPQAKTPNIDRLAKLGTTFTHAYCAVPACEPARAALMSGLRPWTSACYLNGNRWKEHTTEGFSLNAQFKNAGYHVAGAGKIYHSDTYFESEWSEYMSRELYSSHGKGVQKNEGYHGTLKHDLRDEDIGDWQIVDWCIERLQETHEKPLFLACGLHKPHLPFAVPRKYYDLFPRDEIQLPPHRPDDLADIPPAGVRMAKPGGDHAKFLKSGRWKDAVQSYLATCAYTDMNIGRLLDALEKSPHADNTIIVLWGDHGWSFGEKSHWRKFALWEEPTRAPLIWVAPGVTQAGTVCDRTVDTMTIYPTLCELAGIRVPAHVDGPTAVPLLRNPAAPWPHPAMTTHGFKNHAIRTETYRFIQYADGSEELYDHTHDPNEWTNIAGRAGSSTVLEQLRNHLPSSNARPRGK